MLPAMRPSAIRLLPSALLLLAACQAAPQAEVKTFEDCIAAGNPVLESFPRQCKTPDGRTFTENLGNADEKKNLIRADRPQPNEAVSGQLVIEGEARGTWFFEASFPIRLEDDAGNTIATSHAEAQGEWMTEEFVPFSAEITIPGTTAATGMLVLEKDNPSGLPEHADELRIPIRFR